MPPAPQRRKHLVGPEFRPGRQGHQGMGGFSGGFYALRGRRRGEAFQSSRESVSAGSKTRNTIDTEPRLTRAPSRNGVGSWMRAPSTNVPCRLSRSSSCACPSRTVTRAWRRETEPVVDPERRPRACGRGRSRLRGARSRGRPRSGGRAAARGAAAPGCAPRPRRTRSRSRARCGCSAAPAGRRRSRSGSRTRASRG